MTAQPIKVIHEDNDLIVINKPAGLPVHPSGRYNYNSVTEIMRAERGMCWNPLPCNRLDRLTSGVMFVGKNAAAAEKMGIEIKSRTVKKEYVAKVIGEFPEGDIVCDQPVMQVSPKLGLNRARASGKPARTVFKRLAYYNVPKDPTTSQEEAAAMALDDTRSEKQKAKDSSRPWTTKRGYSIVRCLPLTGRTHQLRVHLQYLGHPISNDPIYCNQRVFGPSLAEGDSHSDNDAEIITRLSLMGKSEAAETVAYQEMVEEYQERKAEKMTGKLCEVCQTPLYSDPGEQELGIYLHAKRYASGDGTSWSYETELPVWALPPEGVEGPKEVTRETDPVAVAEKVGGGGVLEEEDDVVDALKEKMSISGRVDI